MLLDGARVYASSDPALLSARFSRPQPLALAPCK